MRVCVLCVCSLHARSEGADTGLSSVNSTSGFSPFGSRLQLSPVALPAAPGSLVVTDADGDGDADVLYSIASSGDVQWVESNLLTSVTLGGPGADDTRCTSTRPGAVPCATFIAALQWLYVGVLRGLASGAGGGVAAELMSKGCLCSRPLAHSHRARSRCLSHG